MKDRQAGWVNHGVLGQLERSLTQSQLPSVKTEEHGGGEESGREREEEKDVVVGQLRLAHRRATHPAHNSTPQRPSRLSPGQSSARPPLSLAARPPSPGFS
eukprot:scaffold94132_cov32-Tisochrysis_lutea.AAC.2